MANTVLAKLDEVMRSSRHVQPIGRRFTTGLTNRIIIVLKDITQYVMFHYNSIIPQIMYYIVNLIKFQTTNLTNFRGILRRGK